MISALLLCGVKDSFENPMESGDIIAGLKNRRNKTPPTAMTPVSGNLFSTIYYYHQNLESSNRIKVGQVGRKWRPVKCGGKYISDFLALKAQIRELNQGRPGIVILKKQIGGLVDRKREVELKKREPQNFGIFFLIFRRSFGRVDLKRLCWGKDFQQFGNRRLKHCRKVVLSNYESMVFY